MHQIIVNEEISPNNSFLLRKLNKISKKQK